MKHVVIVGGGFAGLNAAKVLGKSEKVKVTLIDKRNYHLFQPLLYQVAMAALSPADIAAPIRSLLSEYKYVSVIQDEVKNIDLNNKIVITQELQFNYDYLIMALGTQHAYFGNEKWEEFAPGLKTIEQATQIRRRVLVAFEKAEIENDPEKKKEYLTFVIVGGGPTGVELAGAIGEMTRFTLSRDFKNIDPKLARIILIEAAPRILTMYSEKLSSKAVRDLESLGVQVWTSSKVTNVNEKGVEIGEEIIRSKTVLWAAGVKPSKLNASLGVELGPMGRVLVQKDLTIKVYPNAYVLGDQALFINKYEKPLPALAPVALQQGKFAAKNILLEIEGKPKGEFEYNDKGQAATIGRSKAIVETSKFKFSGFFAWLTWIAIHIYYLTGFRNRVFVIFSWAWSHLTFGRGARLIVPKKWQFYDE
ncbi:MAG: NAD(P)/FAD-dependent oxidoreductase [Ignavibacteriae bacterium]|nr:NAD(P)/FAD-dependent oxidoreductase [Ignavibacteriota bacterium]